MKKIIEWLSKTEINKWYDIPLIIIIIGGILIGLLLPLYFFL